MRRSTPAASPPGKGSRAWLPSPSSPEPARASAEPSPTAWRPPATGSSWSVATTPSSRTVAAEITAESLCVAADLTDPDEVLRVFSTVEETWGPAATLVANAGTSLAAPVVETTDEQWQQMLESNLTAPFRCIRRALPSMIESGHGRIVVIASVAAKRGERQVAAYSASKHGVLGLVRAVADEVARHGVTANAVCPGYVDTPMTDQTLEAMSSAARDPRGRGPLDAGPATADRTARDP